MDGPRRRGFLTPSVFAEGGRRRSIAKFGVECKSRIQYEMTEKRQERAQRKHTDRRPEYLIVTLSTPSRFRLQRDDVSAPAVVGSPSSASPTPSLATRATAMAVARRPSSSVAAPRMRTSTCSPSTAPMRLRAWQLRRRPSTPPALRRRAAGPTSIARISPIRPVRPPSSSSSPTTTTARTTTRHSSQDGFPRPGGRVHQPPDLSYAPAGLRSARKTP